MRQGTHVTDVEAEAQTEQHGPEVSLTGQNLNPISTTLETGSWPQGPPSLVANQE